MKYEYLIFNIIVLSGPLFFGSLKKFYFLNKFRKAIISISISAIPFLIWDFAVAERHWFFADQYTLGFRIFGLPIEEILFFFTVPYACLFTWQMVKKYLNTNGSNNSTNEDNNNIFLQHEKKSIILFFFTLTILIIAAVAALFAGKEYTAIALIYFSLSILFDRYWGSKIIFTKSFGIYFLFVSIFTLIFNGYLTWRPIVTYDEMYQMGFRVFTIPIEDFFFGFALMILSTSLFEKFISNK